MEAPFVKMLEKIQGYEKLINEKIDRLVDLKTEINQAFDRMENTDERLLLKYRYLKNQSWEDIAFDLNVSYRTMH